MIMENAIQKAISFAGSQSKLARMLGVSPQAVSNWVRDNVFPAWACIKLEQAFPDRITRYELDPDHFGPGTIQNGPLVLVFENYECADKGM
jgi:DNA-binding transcriptional regulator YdaS (Cro superfamily)